MSATLQKPVRYPAQAGPSTFYLRLKDQMLDALIRSGQPGDRVPSERQLAKQFDASTMTIARILQEFQTEGLLQRVPGKGTFICDGVGAINAATVQREPEAGIDSRVTEPSAATQVRALPADVSVAGEGLKHTWILADVSQEPDHKRRNYWTHRALTTVERTLQRAGVRTTIVNRHNIAPVNIPEALREMKSQQVDSVLMMDEKDFSPSHWANALVRGKMAGEIDVKLVQLRFGECNYLPVDTVTFNGWQGSFLATNHLLKLGHTKIAFLAVPSDIEWLRDRIRGFLQALTVADLPPDELGTPFFPSRNPWDDPRVIGGRPSDVLVNPYWQDWGAKVAREFVEAQEAGAGYTAAVALNDLVAEQALRVFREHGLRVPEDISLVGYDNNLDSQLLGITTVHLPIEEMGETAANLLLQRRPENPHAGNWLLALEPTLVVRGSTGPAPH